MATDREGHFALGPMDTSYNFKKIEMQIGHPNATIKKGFSE